jgi:transcriptional regulator with XRE-family HTH domain
MPISEQLKRELQTTKVSVYQVAKDTGIPQATLSRFLSDNPNQHRDIRLEATADKLAAYFGLSLQPTRAKRK